MTDSSGNTLTFSVKLDRLFDVCRSRDQSEQSAEDVARSVSQIIGRPVTGSQIRALRQQGSAICDPDIIRGLIAHFGVPAEYLTSTGPHAEHLDKQLRLLVAARDAGVKRLALRGGVASDDLDNMLEVINKVPPEVLESDEQTSMSTMRRWSQAHDESARWDGSRSRAGMPTGRNIRYSDALGS